MTDLLLTNTNTRDVIDHVMKKVREAVVSTMGPNGRLAMIASGVSTKTTKDGVTVARSIKFADPSYELVNRVITEPAIKTDRECGDGTTTTIMLTNALYEVFKEFPDFTDQRTIEKLVLEIIDELGKLAIQVGVDDHRLYQMALTSSNQDAELAKMVTDIYKESAGKFPVIELKEGLTLEDKVERVEGRVLRMHYSNPIFGKGQSGGELTLDRFYPVVIDNRLSNPDPVKLEQALLKVVLNSGRGIQAPLLLIARSVEQDFISEIIKWHNTIQRTTPLNFPTVIAMNTNMGGSIGTSEMQDLAAMLNAPMITDVYDLEQIVVPENSCTLTLGISRSFLTDLTASDELRIEAQALSIETMMEQYSLTDRFSLRGKLNEKRIRNLRGELVTIHVGGETNSEIKERIDRYEDVVKAVRSGLENGILPGGGTSLMKAGANVFKRFRDGKGQTELYCERYIAALLEVVTAPYYQLFHNNAPKNRLSVEQLDSCKVRDLSGSVIGYPEDLGIFDTAYASITALKGGLQTAKILANTYSLILGDKVHAVNITR